MIKNNGEYIYIKDYKGPESIKAKVTMELDSDLKHTAKGGAVTVELSPILFIESTGSLRDDFKEYVGYVIGSIIKGLFFDNYKDAEKSYHDCWNRGRQNNFDGDLEILRVLVENPKELLENLDMVSKLGVVNSVFDHMCIDFRSIDGKFDGISNLFIDDLNAFRYMFFGGFGTGGLSFMKDSEQKVKLVLRDTNSCYDLRDIIHTLANIFAYYISKKRRIEYTAKVVSKIYPFMFSDMETLIWDESLEKYLYYYPEKENKFTVSVVAPGITVPHNMTEKYPELHNRLKSKGGERYNNIERVKLAYADNNSNDVIVTTRNKIIGENILDDHKDINSYMAYKGYISPQSGKKDYAVSVDLYTEFKDEADSIIANRIIYDSKPLKALLLPKAKYCFEYFDNIGYNIDKNVTFKCNVCYYSKGGGVTFKSYKDLKTTKIPKDKRDHIFDALCVLCYELGLEPKVVFDRLDVDFLRHYKEPISLYER